MSTGTPTSVILVSRPQIAARVRQHVETDPSIVVFDASEALPPLNVISAKAQMMLLVDRAFAALPAGNEFVERFREANATAEIRVISDGPNGSPSLLEQAISGPAHVALRATSFPLRQMPARRAPRIRMPDDAEVVVSGKIARLIDVSPLGAQVLSEGVLKPGEHHWVRLSDEPRRQAVVVWSNFEFLPNTRDARYRAGLEFR
jgi:hypothetical protein